MRDYAPDFVHHVTHGPLTLLSTLRYFSTTSGGLHSFSDLKLSSLNVVWIKSRGGKNGRCSGGFLARKFHNYERMCCFYKLYTILLYVVQFILNDSPVFNLRNTCVPSRMNTLYIDAKVTFVAQRT